MVVICPFAAERLAEGHRDGRPALEVGLLAAGQDAYAGIADGLPQVCHPGFDEGFRRP